MGDYGGYGGGGGDGGGGGGYGGYGGGGGDDGGGGGGGGGGFMENGGTPSSQRSSGGGPEKKNTSLTPVTVRQIELATTDPDDSFSIDGKKLNKLVLYGRVVEVVEKTTNILYRLNDGTGQLDCTQWIESDEDDAARQSRTQFQEGAYVRIIGHLRVFNDARTLSAFHVNMVEDYNEITHHFLEVLFVHLQNTRGPFNPAHKAGAATAAATDMAGGGGYSHSGEAVTLDGAGSKGLQDLVLQTFSQNPGGEEGLSVLGVLEKLKGHGATEKLVREHIEYLTNEGHLYSTIDEDHYKSTESMGDF